MKRHLSACFSLLVFAFAAAPAFSQVAVRGKTVYTMGGAAIENGVVVIRDGKIAEVGPADQVAVPAGFRVLEGAVVTPGLVDAHSVVGLTGIYNQPHDQDQLERSAPIQPELRAIDAFNTQEALLEYIRGFGITTVHTGHAPGELISGQTCVVKTIGNTLADALLLEPAAVAATIGSDARKNEKKSPGTRGKMSAMLREQFIKAQEYAHKLETAADDKKPDRDLKLEVLARVLKGEVPLMVSADRAQDIASALRLREEFGFKLILDSAAEAYLLIEQIKATGVPVIVHASMVRAYGDRKNMSFETAAKLHEAGIMIALQSGYEDYVPKTRVALFEAAIAAANGLSFEEALATITIDAARIVGVADRVGSLEPGKDGDVAIYDGDPFEYATHCVGVIIDGQVVSTSPR
ncbi:MAG: amidohydrolase family protein [Phycisphaerales bacterium]|nr:amidohydrolase family protein [Phycisphaerales bacterium]